MKANDIIYPQSLADLKKTEDRTMRSLANLIKISSQVKWTEIAKAVHIFEPETWSKLCDNLDLADDAWYTDEKDEGNAEFLIRQMYESDKAVFSALMMRAISRRMDWGEILRKQQDLLLAAPMHFQVSFDGTLEDLARTYADRTGLQVYEAKLAVLDFYLIHRSFQLESTTVQMESVPPEAKG